MLTYLLGDFIECDIEEGRATIYVVRDDKTVLYVGKTVVGIRERWLFSASPHIIVNNLGWQGWSAIGCVIADLYPNSRNWQIDLYTAKECRAVVLKHFGHHEIPTTETAELALIQELRPLFNVANAGYEREIPAKFARGPAMATLAMDRLMGA